MLANKVEQDNSGIMTELSQPAHFLNDDAFRGYSTELVSLVPEICRSCYHVAGKIIEIAESVDNDEVTELAGKEQARALGLVVGEGCTSGYSRQDGCGYDVLCRQG